MEIFIGWLLLSILVGAIGSNRRIGFGVAFIVALLLSPLVGLIVALLSRPRGTAAEMERERVIAEHDRLKAAANVYSQKQDTSNAIRVLQEALQHYAGDPITHFNLACMYSLTQRKDEAFHSLGKAVSLGYSKLDRLASDTDLAWLRSQSQWTSFVSNGYQLHGTSHIDAETSKVDRLERLAKLKTDGVLSADEFEAEKRRILGGAPPSEPTSTTPPPKPQSSGDVYDIPMR